MAVKASATITLSCVVDVYSTTRYYLLQASTLSKPSKPTSNPPSGSWTDTEPGYTSGSTNSLYFTDLTIFSDGTWAYSAVSLSSSYEAAKAAYNKAVAAQNTAQQALSNTEVVVGTQTAATGAWTGVASFSSLQDGQQIVYWLPYAGSGSASLNLTLSSGSTTGAIPCYYSGNTRITTHYPAGNFFGHPDNKPGNTTQAGYSDCSAAVRAAIKAATGIDIGSNTSAQINNRNKKGLVVHTTEGCYPDESKLLPGDCLYFKGNTSHPLDVGHVEMYTGPNECYGHGSGTGPTKKNLKDYCKSRATSKKRYFMAIRWILDEDSPKDTSTGLHYGSEGEDVKILQQNLISLGYDCGSYGADGDFGSATQSAVIAFQEANQLPATGIVDEITQAKIAELLESAGDVDVDETLVVPIPNGITIASGSWNVRTGPGVEFASAGIVRTGTILEKVDIGDWLPVVYNGEVRYISPRAVK